VGYDILSADCKFRVVVPMGRSLVDWAPTSLLFGITPFHLYY